MAEAKPTRVRPNATAAVGKVKVRNRTTNSIEVTVEPDGTVTLVNCCLEEQGM